MPKQPNRKQIGFFILIGFIALLSLLVHSVLNKIIVDRKNTVVMYFEESLKGLSLGSPIVLNGVEIGKVTRIELISDPMTLSFRTPVYAQLHPMRHTDSFAEFWKRKSTLDILIEKGLRARLITQNYLTGQLMIELIMNPDSPPNLHKNSQDADHNIPEIPTVLSPAGELSKGLQNTSIKRSLEKLEKILDSLDKQLPILLPALAKTTQNVSVLTQNLSPRINDTIDNFNKTLSDISDATLSLRNLTDYLERHPESLLKGKK
ncbi:MAG: MlaD family protein [Alphaproteobacteria bacterium]